MERITGTTRLGVPGNPFHGESAVSPEFPQFVIHNKPPPSYEESQQQQSTFGNDANEVSQADKLEIYRHPLFPLLAMLFDKCEWATGSQEGPNTQTLQNDIRSFLLHLGQDGKSLMSGNDETDNLMVKAILVLKIHLLEIEKVNELCKDFCQRYIACLKGKLQTDNMLGIFSSGCDGIMGEIANDSSVKLNQLQSMSSLAYLSQPSNMPMAVSTEQMKTLNDQLSTALQSTQVPSLPTMVLNTSTNQNATSVTISSMPNTIYGSSLPALDAQYKSPVSGTPNQSLRTVPLSGLPTSPPRKQSRRSILPKHATNTMKAWLFQHIAHPYPSEEEKRILARQTDLSLLQVNNWFINARRRILQPMLESSNPETTFKSKKAKPNQGRLAQRFWPESLVQTIQSGSSNAAVQFPQPTVHIIPGDLKDGVPIAVVSNTNPLVSTGIPIQCVQSEKLPILTMLTCPTQTLNQAELVTVTNENSINNNVSETSRSVAAVSVENNHVISADTAKADVIQASEQGLTQNSQLQITTP